MTDERLRRLHFLAWLYQSGRIGEWHAGQAGGERGTKGAPAVPRCAGGGWAGCPGCGRALQPIWYGSPGAYDPRLGWYGGPFLPTGGPILACGSCRSSSDRLGEPYRGPSDPLSLR